MNHVKCPECGHLNETNYWREDFRRTVTNTDGIVPHKSAATLPIKHCAQCTENFEFGPDDIIAEDKSAD